MKIRRRSKWSHKRKIIKIDESRALFGLHCVDGQKSKERQELEFLENEITDRTIELKKRGDALSRLNDETIVFIGGIIESRDIENSGHVNRVRTLTNILANQVMEAYPEYGLTFRFSAKPETPIP